MADTTQVSNTEGSEGEEAAEPRRRKGAVSYDTGLGATCMIWFVVIGLGLLIGIELVWGLSNMGAISR